MALLSHIRHIKMEVSLIPGPVKIMQDTKAVCRVQLHAPGAKGSKAGSQFGSNADKISAGVLDVPFIDRHSDIFLLNDSIGPGCLVDEHFVILTTVLIQIITTHGHKNRLFKVRLTLTAVTDSQLGSGSTVQTIQQFRIGQKHRLLVLPAGNLVVDVRKAEGFGELHPHLKNAVRPDTLNRDHILHPAGDIVRHPVLPHNCFNTFNHGAYIPPSPAFPSRASTICNTV